MKKTIYAALFTALLCSSCSLSPSSSTAGSGGPSSYNSRRFQVFPVKPDMTAYRGVDEKNKFYSEAPRLPGVSANSGQNYSPDGQPTLTPVAFDQYSTGSPLGDGVSSYDQKLHPWEELIYGGQDGDIEGARAYRFGVNDQITLKVDDHEEFSGKLQVLTDGTIEIPVVKDRVQALHRTVPELKRSISNTLSEYIKGEPEISIGIDFAAGLYYYILGEVKNPGRYPMGINPVTVSEAVFRANSSTRIDSDLGGGSSTSVIDSEITIEDRMRMELDTNPRYNFRSQDSGDLRKVYLITPHRSKPTRKIINVKAILMQGRTSEDMVIKCGQIVFVPSASDERIVRFVDKVLKPLDAIRNADNEGDYWYDRFKK